MWQSDCRLFFSEGEVYNSSISCFRPSASKLSRQVYWPCFTPELNNPANAFLKCQQVTQSGEFMIISCLFSHLFYAAWRESRGNGWWGRHTFIYLSISRPTCISSYGQKWNETIKLTVIGFVRSQKGCHSTKYWLDYHENRRFLHKCLIKVNANIKLCLKHMG